MTEDERCEVEELAQLIINDPHPVRDTDKFTKQCISLGYRAGRDSMRGELRAESALRQMDIKQCMRLDNELKAERERSSKLIGFLKNLRFFTKDSALLGIVERAITQYESQSK